MWNNVRQLNLAANALHVVLVLLLLAAAGYWAIQRPEFRLRELQIDGDTTHISSPEASLRSMLRRERDEGA